MPPLLDRTHQRRRHMGAMVKQLKAELEDAMQEALKQTVAGLTTALPDGIDDADITITLSGRQASITLEEGPLTLTQDATMSRLYRNIEEEAEKHQRECQSVQDAIDESVSPLANYSSEEEGDTGGPSVKDVVINS